MSLTSGADLDIYINPEGKVLGVCSHSPILRLASYKIVDISNSDTPPPLSDDDILNQLPPNIRKAIKDHVPN